MININLVASRLTRHTAHRSCLWRLLTFMSRNGPVSQHRDVVGFKYIGLRLVSLFDPISAQLLAFHYESIALSPRCSRRCSLCPLSSLVQLDRGRAWIALQAFWDTQFSGNTQRLLLLLVDGQSRGRHLHPWIWQWYIYNQVEWEWKFHRRDRLEPWLRWTVSIISGFKLRLTT